MKSLEILFALFGISVMVNGAWWAAAVQPVMLSIGAVFAALNLDLEPILDAKPIELRKLMIFKNEKENEKENKKHEPIDYSDITYKVPKKRNETPEQKKARIEKRLKDQDLDKDFTVADYEKWEAEVEQIEKDI